MDGKMLARIGAVVFVALAITATAIEMTGSRRRDPVRAPARREIRCARNSPAVAHGRGRRAIRPACAPGPRTAAASWVSRTGRVRSADRRTHRRLFPPRQPHATRTGAADMQAAGVIDHFLEVFTRYIDSGFGLLARWRSSPPR
jgi:hypothetical protein